jgi:UDP-glucose 4-epimerase
VSAKLHILILGGGGFIGSRLSSRLLKRGYRVDSLGKRECDLTDSRSIPILKSMISEHTCIVFCSTISRLREDSLRAYHANVSMAENVAFACEQSSPMNVVFFSSVDIFGRPPLDNPITENSRIHPAGYYGLAKYVSERILQEKLCSRLPLAILRLPGIYSLDEDDPSILGALYRALKAGQPVFLNGQGEQKRTYLNIKDLDNVVEEVINRRWCGIANLGTWERLSIAEAVKFIGKAVESKSSIQIQQTGGKEFDIVVDVSMARKVFSNFQPKPLSAYIKELIMKQP